jgi:hypothetical protein
LTDLPQDQAATLLAQIGMNAISDSPQAHATTLPPPFGAGTISTDAGAIPPTRQQLESPGSSASARSVASSPELLVSASSGEACSPSAEPVPLRPRMRLQDNILKPKKFIDVTIRYDEHHDFLCTHEPHSLHEAIADANWKEAMDA